MLDDLKSLLGEKGFWIVIIIAVVLFVLMLGKGDSGEEMTTPTAYTSYPDAVTNANTIIDSINQQIESTGGYIEDGLKDLSDRIDKGFADVDESINDIGNSSNNSGGLTVNTRPSTTNPVYDYVRDTVDKADSMNQQLGLIKGIGGVTYPFNPEPGTVIYVGDEPKLGYGTARTNEPIKITTKTTTTPKTTTKRMTTANKLKSGTLKKV